MAEADAKGSTSGAVPQLSDLLLRSLKRTYDMFSTESVTAAIPTFLPSQRLKVAIKVHQEYTLPKGVTQPTDGEGDNGAHVLTGEAGATPSGAKGRSNPTDTTNIIKTLETEKEEKMFQSALSGAAQGKGGGGALVEYKGPGGALIAAPGAAAGAGGGGALALRRQPPKVPKPKWHAPWKLQSVIAGHLGWVRSIAFDPSNEWFVTGSGDRTIKVWDLAKCTAGAEGGLKLTLTGHISAIRGLSVSPRHPYLFSCGEDKMVKCWDLEQNRVIRSYHGHLSGVYSLALHPTLDILITGGRDSVARVWDIRTKHQIHVLGGHTNVVGAVATNSVDPQVITGSHDATIKLWDLAAGKSLMTLTHHKKSVRDLKIHPKEQSFVSGSPDNLKKWQVRDGRFLRNLSGHNTVINALAVNEDDVLVSCGDNGSMYLWDYQTGYNFQRLQTIVQPGSLDAEAGIFACCFDLSGTRFLTGEADKSIKIYREDPEATEDSYPIDMRAWTEECLRPKRY